MTIANAIFDAHCDTVLKMLDEGENVLAQDPRTHLDGTRLLEAGVRCQVFACFARRAEWGDETEARSRSLLEAVRALDGRGPFVIPTSAAALRGLRERDDTVGILLAVEGGDALGGRPEAVAELHSLGVRYITLAWDDNDLTGGAFGSGAGLSELGRRVVAEMEHHRTLVDVSHMSDRAFADVAETTTRTFIATHSNCRSVCDSPRNLTDPQIRALADQGGVIGTTFVAGFLTDEVARAQRPIYEKYLPQIDEQKSQAKQLSDQLAAELAAIPAPPLSAVLDHLDHVVQIGGVEAAAFGSDFDGFPQGPKGLRGCQDYPAIIDRLADRGYGSADIDKICWDNWTRVFVETFA